MYSYETRKQIHVLPISLFSILNSNYLKHLLIKSVSKQYVNIIQCKKGKGKVVPVFLTEHHAMTAYWGVEV